jgi:hypothetical protein
VRRGCKTDRRRGMMQIAERARCRSPVAAAFADCGSDRRNEMQMQICDPTRHLVLTCCVSAPVPPAASVRCTRRRRCKMCDMALC